jgi:hypothetical protein
MFDLGPMFKELGILLKEEDFALYDPLGETLFVVCGEETEMHKLEALLMPICYLQPATIESTVWLANGDSTDSPFAKATLHVRSGQIAKLGWNRSKDQPILSFEVEPTSGETGAILDLRYEWIAPLPGKEPESRWRSQSAITLANGIPSVSEATKLPVGPVVKQGLRVSTRPTVAGE